MAPRFAPFALAALLAPVPLLAQQLEVAPFVQDVTTDSAWIVWETDTADESRVTWGEGDALDREATGDIVEMPGDARLHRVQLTGLQPDTEYSYRAHTGSLSTVVATFVSAPPRDGEHGVRLVAMSDMQIDRGNPTKFGEIVNEGIIPWVTDRFGEPLHTALGMVVVPGDLVDNGTVHDQWRDDFFGPAATLFAAVPVYPVYGNHEADTEFFRQYFVLPDNGTEGFEEHWWYADRGNIRLIGLDSNAFYRLPQQLTWLEGVLAEACDDDAIDFVFAQLHHPHHSELWLPGEAAYTGEVITRMEQFSTDCGKPSIHFFGHTHGYSRGQSRDHAHLMVNVASAGGNIDYWGETAQADYDEYTVSNDTYGFVVIDVAAGDDPRFDLTRVSRGDEFEAQDNVTDDTVTIRRHNPAPATPVAWFPVDEDVNPWCTDIAASVFADPDDEGFGAAHWQVADTCDDFSTPVLERWVQSENRYFEEDLQAGDDLTDLRLDALEPGRSYCWRVRYRDVGLGWSAWSTPAAFSTGAAEVSDNLLTNPGAEDGMTGWSITAGVVESIASSECDGIEAATGERLFAVGGVCEGSEYGEARQRIDLSAQAADIAGGNALALAEAMMASYSGNDRAGFFVVFLDADGAEIGRSEEVENDGISWRRASLRAEVPAQAAAMEMVLTGRRVAGDDNDSYVDDVSLRLALGAGVCTGPPQGEEQPASEPFPEPEPEPGDDTGIDAGADARGIDAGADAGGADAGEQPDDGTSAGSSGGCSAAPGQGGGAWLAALGLAAVLRRRR